MLASSGHVQQGHLSQGRSVGILNISSRLGARHQRVDPPAVPLTQHEAVGPVG